MSAKLFSLIKYSYIPNPTGCSLATEILSVVDILYVAYQDSIATVQDYATVCVLDYKYSTKLS